MKKILFAIWTIVIIAIVGVIIIGAWWNNRSPVLLVMGIIAGVMIIVCSVFTFKYVKKI